MGEQDTLAGGHQSFIYSAATSFGRDCDGQSSGTKFKNGNC